MEMKQNQTFSQATYSNLTPFLSKHIKVFQWLSKSTFLNIMSRVKPNSGYETKSDIFSREIFKPDIIFIGHKILKHANDFCN